MREALARIGLAQERERWVARVLERTRVHRPRRRRKYRLVVPAEPKTVDGRSLAVGCHARSMQFWTPAAREALAWTLARFQPGGRGRA